MTELIEPIWVGMDVDAELARCEQEERRQAKERRSLVPMHRRSLRAEALCARLPLPGSEVAAPRLLLTA